MILIIFEIMLYFVEHILFLKECTSDQDHTLENWEKALHYVSISVLALFVVEVSLKLYAFGLEYLYKPLNVFEFTIVYGGFLAEVLLPSIGGDIATLLIALRMIRLIRFAHAFQESFEREKDYEISLLNREIKELKARLMGQETSSLTIAEPDQAVVH
jgi:hypothetical protein